MIKKMIKILIQNVSHRVKLSLLYNKLISKYIPHKDSDEIFKIICEIRNMIADVNSKIKNCDNNTILGSDGDWIVRYLKSCDKKLVKIYERRKCIY